MAETPADQAFAQEWRQVTQELARAQIRELVADRSWAEAVAALSLKVRLFSQEQLEALDPTVFGVALSRTPPLPWPDDALIAIALLNYWCPGQWPDAVPPDGLPTVEQLHAIHQEAERLEAAWWGVSE